MPFHRFLAADDKFLDAWINKASVLSSKMWLEEAYDAVKNALAISPDDRTALDIKAYLLHSFGENQDALRVLNNAIGKYPMDKYLWYHKGNIQLALAQYDDAERCYERSLAIDPQFPEVHNSLAIVSSQKKNYSKSKRELREAIRINPTLAIAHENLAKVTVSAEKRKNFWDFWNSSPAKKAAAVTMVVMAVAIIVYYPLSGIQAVETTEKVEEGSSTTTNTTTTKSPQVLQSSLILAGIVVAIILFPELKSAKVGDFEIELREVQEISSEPLALADEPQRMIVDRRVFVNRE
jgi:tetratricopeptide (TPR) repeat protein